MKKNICVFCSSSDVLDDIYYKVAKELAFTIAKNRQTLLFGGSNVGLMKQLAENVKDKGGYIIGVIPEKIKNMNLACEIVDELIITSDMHTRKAKLEKLADGYIALPGGFGTLDELSEVITLKQLDYHNKPVVLLNINGFFNNLLNFYETIYDQKFAKPDYKNLYYVTDNISDAFKYIENYKGQKQVSKWYKTKF